MLLDKSIIDGVEKRWKAYGGDRLSTRDLSGAGKTAVRPADASNSFWARRALAPAPDGQTFRTIATDTPPIEGLGLSEAQRAERFLGTSDLIEVVFLEAALKVARTVGRVRVNGENNTFKGYGTGFMVSSRLMLTNWHVLKTERIAEISTIEFGYETKIGDGAARDGVVFRLRPDEFYLPHEALDYALVAVEAVSANGRTLQAFGFNCLIDDDEGLIVKGQFANIIQHPSGQPKQLAFRQNEVVAKPEHFLHYRTDTATGSSGAPVFNDQWQVVALHRAGVPERNAAGQVMSTDNTVWHESMGEDRVKWIANEGVRIPALLAHWRAQPADLRGRTLLEEVFSPAKPAVTEEIRQPGARVETPHVVEVDTRKGRSPETLEMIPEVTKGVATWTLPLKVSVALGDLPPVSPNNPPPPAVPPPLPVAPVPAPDLDTVLRRAREVLMAGRSDIVRIRAGWQFDENGVTDRRALIVVVKQKRTPAKLAQAGVTELPATFEGYPVEVMGPSVADILQEALGPQPAESLLYAALPVEEITYRPPEGLKLEPITDTMRVVAHVSPDAGWPTLRAFIAGAETHLVGAMYEFTADHIRAVLEQVATRDGFEKLTLVLDSSRGSIRNAATTIDSEKMIRDMRETVPADKLDVAWVKLGSVNGWVNHDYHIKVLIRDGTALWLSSGNWKDSGQPDRDPAGDVTALRPLLRDFNREWHAVIEHEGLASVYRTAIMGDFDANRNTRPAAPTLPELYYASSGTVVTEEFSPNLRYFAPFDERREFTVQPILTPDNYLDIVLPAVRGAEDSLLIQNQSLSTPRQSADARYVELWDAILEKQRRGVDVRLIFRRQDRDPTGGREMFEALKDYGFDPKRIRVQKGCHTKGMIIDGRRVLLGSHNLTHMGATTNRDASLLFDDEGLAAYFTDLFEHDWANMAEPLTRRSWRGRELVPARASDVQGLELFDWKAWFEAQ